MNAKTHLRINCDTIPMSLRRVHDAYEADFEIDRIQLVGIKRLVQAAEAALDEAEEMGSRLYGDVGPQFIAMIR